MASSNEDSLNAHKPNANPTYIIYIKFPNFTTFSKNNEKTTLRRTRKVKLLELWFLARAET